MKVIPFASKYAVTEDDVRLIKSLLIKHTVKEVSDITKVKYNIVSKISRKVTWKHV